MKNIRQHIEAILFSSEHPVTIKEMVNCLVEIGEEESEITNDMVEAELNEIAKTYEKKKFSFELTEIGGGFQFMTKPDFHETISKFLNQKTRKRLSTSALETLSIIAYKQPVTKSQVEEIRGVGCDYAIEKLLEKELIEIMGRAETPGRPLLYRPSEMFMDYFGLKNFEDLPQLRDIQPDIDNTIGESTDKLDIEDNEVTDNSESEPAKAVKEEIIPEATLEPPMLNETDDQDKNEEVLAEVDTDTEEEHQ